jgi:multidrug transporter EmrE-like cation transporter
MSLFLLIVIVSFIEFIGDASFKEYARSDSLMYMSVGIACYLLMCVFLVYILKITNVSYMNLQWDGVSVLIETGLAMLLLNETLSNNVQYGGAMMIIMGVLALNYGKIPK